MVNYLGGAAAGLTTRTLLYPLEFARTRLSSQVGPKSIGILGCLSEALAKEGLRGIYKGALVSLIGVTVFRSTYFGLFDTFKEHTDNSIERWGLSYLSTLAAIALTYPSDTVRRRLMVTARSGNKYGGFMDCAKQIWRREGATGFFCGAPTILLQSVTGATVYFIFDRILKDVKALTE